MDKFDWILVALALLLISNIVIVLLEPKPSDVWPEYTISHDINGNTHKRTQL